MIGKVFLRRATREDELKYTHYLGTKVLWCGAKLDKDVRHTLDLTKVDCPWCRQVVRNVVNDWNSD